MISYLHENFYTCNLITHMFKINEVSFKFCFLKRGKKSRLPNIVIANIPQVLTWEFNYHFLFVRFLISTKI